MLLVTPQVRGDIVRGWAGFDGESVEMRAAGICEKLKKIGDYCFSGASSRISLITVFFLSVWYLSS